MSQMAPIWIIEITQEKELILIYLVIFYILKSLTLMN
jgi:hypothetical protein